MNALALRKQSCATKAHDIAVIAAQLAATADKPWTIGDIDTFHDHVTALRDRVIDLVTTSRYLRKLASASVGTLQKCVQLGDIKGIVDEVFAPTQDVYPRIDEAHIRPDSCFRDYAHIYVKWSVVYPKWVAKADDLDSYHVIGQADRDGERAVVCEHKVRKALAGTRWPDDVIAAVIAELSTRSDQFLAIKAEYAGKARLSAITAGCCAGINDHLDH